MKEVFRLIADHVPNMIFINQRGRVVYANHKCTEIMGYTREEFLSADFDFMSLIAPESIGRVKDAYQQHLEGGGSDTYEYTLQTRDGRHIEALMESRLVTYEGEPAILGSITDITERKRAEDALRFRLAFESLIARISRGFIDIPSAEVEEGIIRALGEVGRFTGASVAAIFLFDENQTHASNTYEWSADPADSMQAAQQNVPANLFAHYWKIIQSQEPVIVGSFEDLPPEAVGEIAYNQEHGFRPIMLLPMLLKGEFYGALVFFGELNQRHDWHKELVELLRVFADTIVSTLERKRVAGALSASEERYRAVSELISDFAYGFKVEPGGKLVSEWVTGALTRISGLTYEELEDRGGWSALIHPDDRQVMAGHLQVLQSGDASTVEYRILAKDGEARWMRDYARPLRDAQAGRTTHIYGAVQDITERKKLTEQFLVSQKMETVGRLAGGIAHDFNNLLGIITGLADLILHDLNQADPMCADVEQIAQTAKKASGLTNKLLAFSRQKVLQPVVFDINGTVREMDKMLGRVIGEDIDLFLNLAPEVMPIESDPVLVEQVIMNLAVNARDAMPKGGKLVIETHGQELDTEAAHGLETTPWGPQVVLSVSDSGLGLDDATRSRIFEPFFTTKGVGKGTGLGLSTVYSIVKQSQGTIGVQSSPGLGTSFKIYLPRAEGKLTEVPDLGVALRRGTETVLVVEDEAMLLSLISRMLKMNGYQVIEASHGGEALLLCEQHEGDIHLLLTDVVMPQMNGHQLQERLTPLRPEMKVLFMSGYTDNTMILQGILERGLPFVQKPFSAQTLATRVRRVLDGP